MTQQQTGGPAFPQHGWSSNPEVVARMQESGCGLSVLDWFAGLAMAGICAKETEDFSYGTWGNCAKNSYDAAAAMLAEKQRRENRTDALRERFDELLTSAREVLHAEDEATRKAALASLYMDVSGIDRVRRNGGAE